RLPAKHRGGAQACCRRLGKSRKASAHRGCACCRASLGGLVRQSGASAGTPYPAATGRRNRLGTAATLHIIGSSRLLARPRPAKLQNEARALRCAPITTSAPLLPSIAVPPALMRSLD